MNRDMINGYGSIFRIVTPILITIALFILGSMKGDIRDVKNELKEVKVGFNNHLEHHRIIEVSYGERLKCIEGMLERKVR